MIDVLEKIENIINKLEIEACYQIAETNSLEYIIFDIYDEKDTTFCEDSNLEITCYITLSYWHEGKAGLRKYRKIKEAFKKEGFLFDSIKTLKSTKPNSFGKNYTFKIEEEN